MRPELRAKRPRQRSNTYGTRQLALLVVSAVSYLHFAASSAQAQVRHRSPEYDSVDAVVDEPPVNSEDLTGLTNQADAAGPRARYELGNAYASSKRVTQDLIEAE